MNLHYKHFWSIKKCLKHIFLHPGFYEDRWKIPKQKNNKNWNKQKKNQEDAWMPSIVIEKLSGPVYVARKKYE